MDRVSWGPVRGLRIAIAAFVTSLILVLAVVAIGGYLLTHPALEGSETHQALCALSGDLERRTDEAREFLRHHPHGIPGLVSGSQIRESTHNQERSLEALSTLSC